MKKVEKKTYLLSKKNMINVKKYEKNMIMY